MKADAFAKPPTNLYEIMVALMRDEEEVALKVKESEKEVSMSSVSPPITRLTSGSGVFSGGSGTALNWTADKL